LKLLCANKNFICDFETQLFHREIGLKHWRTKTNDNAQLAENVVILLLTFCEQPKVCVLETDVSTTTNILKERNVSTYRNAQTFGCALLAAL
jgi:hypothetical protein